MKPAIKRILEIGIKDFEIEILQELREVTGNGFIVSKQIRAWSTDDLNEHFGEVKITLPRAGVKVAMLKR